MLLVDADEWGQIVALGVLERYAREFLERPKGAGGERLVDGEGVKTDEQKRQDGLEETTETEDQDQDLDSDLDQDLHLLLHCVHPLFQSRNPAVILSASKLFFALAPNIAPEGSEEILQKEFVGPLLRLITVRGGRGEGGGQVGSVVMDVVKEMAQERPVSRCERLDRSYNLEPGSLTCFTSHSGYSNTITLVSSHTTPTPSN